MKPLPQLIASAKAAAEARGDIIGKPFGTRDGLLYLDATRGDSSGAGLLCEGSPYGYVIDMETGETRPCTRAEQEELENRSFYEGLVPVSE